MKRIGSSDSFTALMSMCPTTADEHMNSPGGNNNNSQHNIYNSSREYHSILDGVVDEEGCVEECGHVPEKKRRLSVEQVKALERNFEVENKLEPDRKSKLAQELGLQPRQVAVWFQNRRARWKTKQLERDYGLLKSSFDSLKHNYESLQHDNQALIKEIKELKSKLNEEDNSEPNLTTIKEENLGSKSEHKRQKTDEPINQQPNSLISEAANLKKETGSNPSVGFAAEFKDGPSDSDSSAILNDDHSPNASNSHHLLISSPNSFRFNCSSSSSPPSISCFGFTDSRSDCLGNTQNNVYHPQFVKMEEHDFFGVEETCNFFSEEQPPSLHWYSADPWT